LTREICKRLNDNSQHDTLTEMLPAIQRAARSVARKWAQLATANDLTQEIYLRLAETDGSVTKLADMRPAERDASLVRIGHQVADQMRADYEYFTGQFTYSVGEVRSLLVGGALTDQLDGFDARVADVRRAVLDLQKSNSDYSAAIVNRYVFDDKPPPRSAQAKVLERAVDALTLRMNRNRNNDIYEYENGGARRKAIANVEAMAIAAADAGEEIPV
jgi:hypothetical protein